MKPFSRIVLPAVACLATQPVLAQQQQEQAFAYVTYFECDAALEFRADEIVERNYRPHYDAAVKAGEILSWSWLAHYVGGEWRRVLVLTTEDVETLIASAGALGEAILQTTPQSGRDFTEVCSKHVDYIWETTPGIGGTATVSDRGAVGFSTYFRCDINREDEADELVRMTFGPIYNRYVDNGQLVTWNWLRHNVGGQWRRLLSLTAASHADMLNARQAILADMQQGRTARRFEEFNEICPIHEDYMWDIRIENP